MQMYVTQNVITKVLVQKPHMTVRRIILFHKKREFVNANAFEVLPLLLEQSKVAWYRCLTGCLTLKADVQLQGLFRNMMPCSHCPQFFEEKQAKLLMKLLDDSDGTYVKEIEPIKLRKSSTLAWLHLWGITVNLRLQGLGNHTLWAVSVNWNIPIDHS